MHAEFVSEARLCAEIVEHGALCEWNGSTVQRRRDVEDELSSFAISIDILITKNSHAQLAIGRCEAEVAAGIKAVISEEVESLLFRVHDLENEAACERSRLRAFQYCGKWGLSPETLPRQLSLEPKNVFHGDQPLDWNAQKAFDRSKAAWIRFADRLREDAGAMLSLGD